MHVTFAEKHTDATTLIIPLTTDRTLGKKAHVLNEKSSGALTRAMDAQKFTGKKDEYIIITAPAQSAYHFIILVGMGKKKTLDALAAQCIGGKTFSQIKESKVDVLLEDVASIDEIAANFAYGMVLKSYEFTKYKSKGEKKKSSKLKQIHVVLSQWKEAQASFKILEKIAAGVFLARDLTSEPPNFLYPESYAKYIKSQLDPLGVKVTILDETQMRAKGMGALLGVGQGSARKPYLVIMEWQGSKEKKEAPLAFVGKGVTFDTGGISLKPSANMDEMKYDMAGSAAVVGLMKAVAGRKATANVVGVVGLVENMPGGNAQRPGDIVHSMSGQTIEVLNTDAEGRLVLADALWYCQEHYHPKVIVDLATLTGAIVITFGSEYAGLFSNDRKLTRKLIASGEKTAEKLWELPLGKAYDKMLESPAADMQNIGNERGAGSITAAQFLQRFINKDVAWAHLDIAGVAWAKKVRDLCPKGATAFGVRLLDCFIKEHYE